MTADPVGDGPWIDAPGPAWNHRIVWWREENGFVPEADAQAYRNRLEARLDLESEGGWELVNIRFHTIGPATHVWTIWKRPAFK